MSSISEGATVQTLVELTTDDGRVLPPKSVAYVTTAIKDNQYLELDVKIGDEFDTVRATPDQVEVIES